MNFAEGWKNKQEYQEKGAQRLAKEMSLQLIWVSMNAIETNEKKEWIKGKIFMEFWEKE